MLLEVRDVTAGYGRLTVLRMNDAGALERLLEDEGERIACVILEPVAVNMGVPPEDIFVEDQSHSTLANISNSARIMAANGWRSAILVSDPYHMFRACRIAADEGLEARPAPVADSPGWTIPRLRVFYTIREIFAVIAYEMLHVGRWFVEYIC